jgi:hypothetical protein
LFEDTFKAFYERNKEIKAIGVWGKDENLNVDLEFSGAELADIIARLDHIKISPRTVFIRLQFQKYILIIYSLTAEYFLMILADPDIIEGKMKFYLNLYENQLVAAL